MKFSEKLQKLRIGENLSQEEFAEIMNVSRQSVSKWELGQSFPEIEKLIDISSYFGVSIDSLVKDEKEVEDDEITGSRSDWQDKNTTPSKTKKRILFAVCAVCNCICFINLAGLNNSNNIYEAISRGTLSIIGIGASLYALVRFKKKFGSILD